MLHETIVTRIMRMAPSLVGMEWCPFSRDALLHFRGGNDQCVLTVTGIHLFATRQSLLGRHDYIPIDETNHEDWFVEYLAIHSDGSFLQNFLDSKLGFDSSVMLYGTNGTPKGSTSFQSPVHLTLVLGGGNLDVICESLDLMDANNAK